MARCRKVKEAINQTICRIKRMVIYLNCTLHHCNMLREFFVYQWNSTLCVTPWCIPLRDRRCNSKDFIWQRLSWVMIGMLCYLRHQEKAQYFTEVFPKLLGKSNRKDLHWVNRCSTQQKIRWTLMSYNAAHRIQTL